MKNILVPCDFSKASEQALRFAVEIAAISQGEVTVLHVINLTPNYIETLETNPYYVDSMSILAELKRQAAADFDELRQKVDTGNVPVKLAIEQGLFNHAILKSIHQQNADLVVMATKGASGLSEMLIGSNTEKIVRSAPVPVFAIHKNQKVQQIKNIIFPTNIELNQSGLLEKVKALQTFFNARLHLLHVKTPESKQKDQELKMALTNFARFYELDNYLAVVKQAKTEEEGILKYARQVEFSMIAMHTHGHTGLTHLILGSIAENIVNHCPEAVWTYTAHEA
ncbi:universal stress protein [Dyadobacter sp. Leaf189]|uniref:universal stress protein n=1 Tax=Dyadobacter sp. Leaf189 TaxID=1736295 RepID=UPI000701402F|nr:universal stress protein [Dyadobacter sp. Leaf189]KQS27904.1 universal stress protein UspA [Dyadobacter sp. Leaf189]